MNKKAKHSFLIFALAGIFIYPSIISSSTSSFNFNLRNFKTVEDIKEKREKYFTPSSTVVPDRILKILIVPGHDDEYSGAIYGDTREVDLNREVAEKLSSYLKQEPGIEVIISQEQNIYHPFLQLIFSDYTNEIQNFIEKAKKDFDKKIKKQNITLEETNFHNTALPEIRKRLYGINWWANHIDADLVIHIHFNDYAGRKGREKKYDGFSIYIPGEHFRNHKLSKAVAQPVFEELKKIRPVSNLPQEEDGIIEGHELIAIGSNESVMAGSLLIEYGYIYEDVFQNVLTKDVAFDNVAYATYVGIKKFLGENYFLRTDEDIIVEKNKTTTNNARWQFQKAFEGKYPPSGKTFRDCPISGYFGECSQAVK